MNRIISILLSLLFFLNSSGYVLIYIERLAIHRRNIESIIAASKDLSLFEKFIFTKNEYEYKLNWKDEKEFELNGNMYDIAYAEISNDLVIVYCIHDKKEKELILNFEKINKSHSAKDKTHFSQTLSNVFNFIAIENELYKPERIFGVAAISGNYFNYYHSVFKQSLTPPPKIS